MNTDAITQEQEKVVSDARYAMTTFDGRPPLFRWLANYAPEHRAMFFQSDWHVVTREGRHWNVEIGSTNSDKPYKTICIDGRAPAPPIMEHRPPKPEPVKLRESALPPLRVPGAMEYIQQMLSPREFDQFMHELRRQERREQEMRRMSRYEFGPINWDEPNAPVEIRPMRYERPKPPSERDLMALAHAILDARLRSYRPPPPMPVQPPPLPTRRNQ